MDRPKVSRAVPYAASAVMTAGIAFLGWQLTSLHGSVSEGRTEVQALRAQLEAERGERAALEARAAELNRRAEVLAREVEESRAALTSSGQDVGAALQRLEARNFSVEASLVGIQDRLGATARRLDEQATSIQLLRKRLDSVAPQEYGSLLAPTVKISSKSDVGSGTVIFSEKTGDRCISYVLTAHHIVEQNYDPRNPIPLDVYSFRDGQKVREESGVVVAVNPQLDLALIEVRSDRPYEAVAKLIAPDHIADVKLYARVNAIGCPLGYAPTPTSGELTSKNKVLDGQSYWMINAPTIFGNSGGGIYLSDTGEMIGVLSRISAYKNLIDVAVPHMGIITSMSDVYAWVEREHYQFVVDRRYTAEDCARARVAGRQASVPVAADVSAVAAPAKPASVSAKRAD